MTTASLLARPISARQALAMLRANPREALSLLVLSTATAASVAAMAVPVTGSRSDAEQAAQATPEPAARVQEMTPFAVRQVAPDKALALNAALPVAAGPNPAARPFVLKADKQTYARALECLSQAVYYEAAREPEEGQRAVAQVVLNRMRNAAYPASVCGVVYQGSERPTGCQFSFTCDGSLYRRPMKSYWDRARVVAHQALQGYVYSPVGNATHYHANYVMPYWAPTLIKNAVVATHIFYRWPGSWGEPAAFGKAYARRESDPGLLRTAALAAEARFAAAAPITGPVEQTAMVAQAKKELPPELAKLVEAEIGTGGEARVSMKIANPRRGEAASAADRQHLDKAMNSSTSLKWSLTGDTANGADQKPLGRAQPAGNASGTP